MSRALDSLTDGATHIGDNPGNDDLLLAGGLHSGAEVRVVHGVDLAVPMDDGVIGVHCGNLWEDGAVRAYAARKGRSEGRSTR